MSRISVIKEKLAKLIALNFASITTDKGVYDVEGDEIEVGAAIYAVDENGERGDVAEDGEYKIDEDKVLVVENGVIAEIREIEKPAEEEAEPEVEVEAEEEVENPTNEGEESDTEGIVELRKEVNELYAIVNALAERIEKLEGKPAAEPAQEEFEKVRFTGKSKDKEIQAIKNLF